MTVIEPADQSSQNHGLWLWVPAFAGTTLEAQLCAMHCWTYWQGYRRPSFAAYVFDAGS